MDFFKWSEPEAAHKKIVDKTKEEIETLGFHQIISGVTRTWRNQPDSLLDHCWTNAPGRLVYSKNVENAFLDHNIIIVAFHTKGKITDKHEITLRDRKNYDGTNYKEEISKIDWSPLLSSSNIDEINDIFVTEISKILDKSAPFKTYQKRNKFRCWVDDDMKRKMDERDNLRKKARATDEEVDWIAYRKARNKCCKDLIKSKEKYYRNIFWKNRKRKLH